jgi:hypothetical protein
VTTAKRGAAPGADALLPPSEGNRAAATLATAVLSLAVVPNAKATAVDGWHDGALRVRLAAPPVDGKANAALVAWLADQLGLPRRAVRIRRGESSRRKQVEIDIDAVRLDAWLGEHAPRAAATTPRSA